MMDLQIRLGHTFKNINLLTQALTHSSFAYENKGCAWNERLEFLGDAVLEISVSAALYRKFPEMSEGDLTKLRARIVCEGSLACTAKKIMLGPYLRLGRGEDLTGGRERDAILADALEAVFGAVFLDAGYEQAFYVITSLLSDSIAGNNDSFTDYKTYLQEIIQKNSKKSINYVIIDMHGPCHDNTFTAQAVHNDIVLGTGTGKSKKEAEQNAARRALEFLGF